MQLYLVDLTNLLYFIVRKLKEYFSHVAVIYIYDYFDVGANE